MTVFSMLCVSGPLPDEIWLGGYFLKGGGIVTSTHKINLPGRPVRNRSSSSLSSSASRSSVSINCWMSPKATSKLRLEQRM